MFDKCLHPGSNLQLAPPWDGQQRQQEQVKSITELPCSPSSQSTVSLLPIRMTRCQWQMNLASGFPPGILFRGKIYYYETSIVF